MAIKDRGIPLGSESTAWANILKSQRGNFHIKMPRLFVTPLTLRTAAAPAVQAAVKTELSYQNDPIIAFFFAANEDKDTAKVATTSSNSQLENSGLICRGTAHFVKNNNHHPTW